jgi:hypothetical protein
MTNMRHATAVILVASGLTFPFAGFAATPSQTQAKSTSTHAQGASHAMTGVVKSINDTTLVITRSGKQTGEMTFEVDAKTHREGTVAVGAPVSVRYREEGKNHIATAITVQHPKQQAATTHSAPPAK